MALRHRGTGQDVLTRWVVAMLVAAALPVLAGAPSAFADGHGDCPPGTTPVNVVGGVVCVVVTVPGNPGTPGTPDDPGGGATQAAGCFKKDGTEVPCVTDDGTWWSGNQCYAAPYDAPAGAPAWQGNTDGSLWQCSRCEAVGSTTSCQVQIVWLPPGEEPGPPAPGELATVAVGLMPLATAEAHTAPQAPDHTYIGVENWLWVPNAQWASLSKTVTAGATSVTATATPSQVVWNMGPRSATCYSPGAQWHAGMSDAASTSCGFTYDTASSSEPAGVFVISATIGYQVDWTCTGFCSTTSGTLGLVDAPAGEGTMRVLQRQTVVVR